MTLKKWILPQYQIVGTFVGPKTSVQMGGITPSVIEIFEKNEHILTMLKNYDTGQKLKKLRALYYISFKSWSE